MQVMFVGPQGVPLAGRFIYPGETRDVTDEQLQTAVQAHPGWFEVEGVPLTPDPLPTGEGEVAVDEVSDVSSVEHVDQPVAKRRGGSKRSAK